MDAGSAKESASQQGLRAVPDCNVIGNGSKENRGRGPHRRNRDMPGRVRIIGLAHSVPQGRFGHVVVARHARPGQRWLVAEEVPAGRDHVSTRERAVAGTPLTQQPYRCNLWKKCGAAPFPIAWQ